MKVEQLSVANVVRQPRQTKTSESCKEALRGEVPDSFKVYILGYHTHKQAYVGLIQYSGMSIPTLDHNGSGKVSSSILDGCRMDDSTGW